VTAVGGDEGGRWAVTGSRDRTVRIWALPSMQLQRTIRPAFDDPPEGRIDAVALTADGESVAVASRTGGASPRHRVDVFARASGRHLARLDGLPAPVAELRWTRDGGSLVAGLEAEHGVWILRGVDLVKVAVLPAAGGGLASLDVGPEGRIAVLARDGSLRLHRGDGTVLAGATREQLIVPSDQVRDAACVRFAPDGRSIGVGFRLATQMALVDGTTLARIGLVQHEHREPLAGPFEWGADGRTAYPVVGAAGSYRIHRWAMPPLRGANRAATARSEALGNEPRGTVPWRQIPRLGRSGGVLLTVAGSSWGIARPDSTALQIRPDLRAIAGGIRVSADAMAVVVHASDPRPTGSQPPPYSAGFYGFDFRSTPYALWLVARGSDLGTPRRAAVVQDGDAALRREPQAGHPGWTLRLPARVVDFHVSSDYRVMLVALGDGTLRWYAYDDARELRAVFLHAEDRRWVAWTPDGAFDGSPGAEELLVWSVRLQGSAETRVAPVADRAGVRRDPSAVRAAVAIAKSPVARAPEASAAGELSLSIVQPGSGSTTRGEPFAWVRLAVVVAGAQPGGSEPFTHLRVRIDDGAPIVIDRASMRAAPRAGAYDFLLPMRAQQGAAVRAQFVAISDGRESAPATIELRAGRAWPLNPSDAFANLYETAAFNPAARDLSSCREMREVLGRVAGTLREQVALRTPTGKDQRTPARQEPGGGVTDGAVDVALLRDQEVAYAVALMLEGQWAEAEAFLAQRLAIRLQPDPYRMRVFSADSKREYVSSFERDLARRREWLGFVQRAAATRRLASIDRDGLQWMRDMELKEPPGGTLPVGLPPVRPTPAAGAPAADDLRRRSAAVREGLGRACAGARGPYGPYAYTSGHVRDHVEKLQPWLRTLVSLQDAIAVGTVLERTGQLDSAFAIAETGHALRRELLGADHPLTLEGQALLARVQVRRGRYEEARALWSDWLDASSRVLGEELWLADESARTQVLRNNRLNVDGFLSSLVRDARPDAGSRALVLSASRKGLLARAAAEMNAVARAAKDPELRARAERVEQQRRDLAAQALRTEGVSPADLAQARDRLRSAEAELFAAARPLRAPGAMPTVADLQRALAPREALVDLMVFRDLGVPDGQPGSEKMIAVVLSRDRLPQLVRWDDLAPIGAAIRRYRSVIEPDASPPGRDAQLRESAQALTQAVWQPLAAHLAGVERVFLAPDGPLSLMPFHALGDPREGFLVSRLELSVLGSPRDLVAKAPGAAGRQALIVGAPDYGPVDGPAGASRTVGASMRELAFTPLPAALEESREVARLVQARYTPTLLTGAQATEAAVYRVVRPALLHLATHGFFLQEEATGEPAEDPLQVLARSGVSLANANLALRGAAPGGEDGILTALEATTLDLRGTRLVVLSACESAVGRVDVGEGVHGLARAFREAGAQGVLATLWQVDDEATREFMLGFYRRLVAGESPQAALRATQREFIAGRKWQDPHYWAPFVLVGR
jgi:CHAT domain-containing protein